MKELILELLANFWLLLNSIAVFILIGVIIAGIFKLFIPDSFIKKHLGQHDFMANIKAAVLGIPLPLCSCSVIPFVTSLKKSGASNSAIQTFLIATPITGADSIMATYGVFGWLFTLYRLLSSVIIALLAGILTLLFTSQEQQEKSEAKVAGAKDSLNTDGTMFSQVAPVQNISIASASVIGKPLNINVVKAEDINTNPVFDKTQKILSYAFDDIYKDFARSLMVGVFIGALIVTFMPANLVEYLSSNQWLNYLLVLAISLPLYVCATASIPLGLSLLSAGFSPGAAFIFLTAGPASNAITMSVVYKTLGKSSLVIYLFSVLTGSLLFGYLFDTLFADSLNQIHLLTDQEEAPGFIDQVSSVILLYLSIKYIFNKNAKIINSGGGCSGGSCCGSSS